MTYRRSCILLPCHSLEDFPLHHEGESAAGLLAAWTALWHPALLAVTAGPPTWRRGDNPPTDLQQFLILVPGVTGPEIPQGFVERATSEGAIVIEGNLPREEFLRRALEPLAAEADAIDGEVVADFLALGYAYLQVALLTRQMRYSTQLDEARFFRHAVEGAQAAVAGRTCDAKEHLSACFDLLAQERDHFYAVDVYLLDVTLLAPHTLGPALADQLDFGVATNLVLSGQLLRVLRECAPATWDALQRGLAAGHVALLGGEWSEARSPLHSCETVLRRFLQGLDEWDRLLGQRPRVHVRREFGVSVLYPQLLHRLGYLGALHAALGAGRYPQGAQVKIRWQGLDHSALDAIGRVPLDASRPETFLALAKRLGETMDTDHVATVCLAHWPGQVSPAYADLRRIARYGAMLGKFVTADSYFRDTDYPGTSERFRTDQYHSPYLRQAVAGQQPDPLSTSVRYWRRHATWRAIQALDALAALVRNRAAESASSLGERVDLHADAGDDAALDTQLSDAWAAGLRSAADVVHDAPSPVQPGYLLWNPTIAVQRVAVDLPELASLPDVAPPVYAAASDGPHRYVVADVPSMGFVWVPARAAGPATDRRLPPLAAGHRLFNEFLEAHIDPATGGLQALRVFQQRGNRLSQQLAQRLPSTARARRGGAGKYSVMVADRVEVTAATSVLGEITATGRLLDARAATLATFRQRYRVWRGIRVLQLSIELDPVGDLADDPWESYIACRFAWADGEASLWRGVHEWRERAEAKRLEAPLYLDIHDPDGTVTILTGGLPFHRRTDPRMLDSLLQVRGERARRFELGLGIDVKYPLQAALALLTPTAVVWQPAGRPPSSPQGWLFQVDRRNLVATAWEPLVDGGQVTGFRVRLLETAGRAVHATLSAFRSIGSAHRVDFAGRALGMCPVRSGGVEIDVGAHEWLELEARW